MQNTRVSGSASRGSPMARAPRTSPTSACAWRDRSTTPTPTVTARRTRAALRARSRSVCARFRAPASYRHGARSFRHTRHLQRGALVLLLRTVTYKNLHALLALSLMVMGCSAPAETDSAEQDWDSQGGNPTHATHSYLTEHAVDELAWAYPDLTKYRGNVVTGANLELHETPVKDAEQEKLRVEAGGT